MLDAMASPLLAFRCANHDINAKSTDSGRASLALCDARLVIFHRILSIDATGSGNE